METTSTPAPSGYCSCDCRDCFEIAIAGPTCRCTEPDACGDTDLCGNCKGSLPGTPSLAFCADCAAAGCEVDSECCVEQMADDACPGCGCEPGEGRTPGCTDAIGCGFIFDR